MRRHEIAKEDRARLVTEALQKMKGKIAEIAGSHISSRVLQTCVKHCSQVEIDAVFEELRPHFLSLAYNAYVVHLVKKMLNNGWIVSALLAGATISSFTGGALADKFGRTRTFQLDSIPLTIGGFLCATAQSVETMIVGRLLAGIGIGVASAIVPLYISESHNQNVMYTNYKRLMKEG